MGKLYSHSRDRLEGSGRNLKPKYRVTPSEKEQILRALEKPTSFRFDPWTSRDLALEKRVSELDGKLERARVEQALEAKSPLTPTLRCP